MITKELTAEQIQNELSQCTGTEHHYKHFTDLLYTDGVKYFADIAGAYWFIDVVGSYLPTVKSTNDYFFLVNVEVKNDNTCNFEITHEVYSYKTEETEYKIVAEQEIPFTDLPEGKYKFYLIDNVLLLPSEY